MLRKQGGNPQGNSLSLLYSENDIVSMNDEEYTRSVKNIISEMQEAERIRSLTNAEEQKKSEKAHSGRNEEYSPASELHLPQCDARQEMRTEDNKYRDLMPRRPTILSRAVPRGSLGNERGSGTDSFGGIMKTHNLPAIGNPFTQGGLQKVNTETPRLQEFQESYNNRKKTCPALNVRSELSPVLKKKEKREHTMKKVDSQKNMRKESLSVYFHALNMLYNYNSSLPGNDVMKGHAASTASLKESSLQKQDCLLDEADVLFDAMATLATPMNQYYEGHAAEGHVRDELPYSPSVHEEIVDQWCHSPLTGGLKVWPKSQSHTSFFTDSWSSSGKTSGIFHKRGASQISADLAKSGTE